MKFKIWEPAGEIHKEACCFSTWETDMDAGVIDFIMQRNSAVDEKAAIVSKGEVLTYRELHRKSDAVAQFLRNNGINEGDMVPVVCERSVDFIVGIIGVAKAGCTYIPVDNSNPQLRKRFLIERSRSKVSLLSREVDSEFFKDMRCAPFYIDRLESNSVGEEFSVDIHSSQAVYVIFTSGTTGTPKGVIVEYKSLDNVIKWHNEKFLMGPECRMTSVASIGFDVCQWEIWSSLTSGACLYLPDDEARLDSSQLLGYLNENKITHAFVPTVLAPDMVRNSDSSNVSLKYLFTAGEKLPPVNTDHVSYSLIDYYGPTEATIFATCNHVESSSLKVPDSIGHPVADTEVHILDDSLRLCSEGDIGEICLAGTCLARGYLDDPVLTDEKFIRHSAMNNKRLYRTGDLGRWLPNGKLQFLGRVDDQVKIRGNRVELGEVAEFLTSQEEVEKAAVVVANSEVSSEKQIVAFVVARNGADLNNKIISGIEYRMGTYLPSYMLPSALLTIGKIPLTVNGKIDKNSLLDRYQEYLQNTSSVESFLTPEEKTISEIWRNVLGRRNFDAEDDFFRIGGHSLFAARIMKSISDALGVKTYIRDIYEYPTVTALSAAIAARKNSSTPSLDREPVRALTDDIYLPDEVAFGSYRKEQLTNPEHILLTGATGFVGAQMLEELLRNSSARLHCLVRGTNDFHARKRLEKVLEKYCINLNPEQAARVEVYASDISRPCFAMEEGAFRELSGTVDVIYHSASSVNFIQPYSYMKRDNVEGLRQVIAFAAKRRTKPLILFSTISVYSWGHLHTGKTVMREDDDIDQNLPAVVTDIGYVRSKWVMEKIADLAAENGLPLMTFRLGYATLNSRTGLCADYQWWGRMVKTCIQYGAIPDLRELREGHTTVDYMTRAIGFISKNPGALGKKFNLIHRDENNLTLKDFFRRLEDYFGLSFKTISYKAWRELWEHDEEAHLYPLLSLFKDNMYEGQSTVELYQDTYRWRCDNVSRFLEGSGINEPRFDRRMLETYLKELTGVSYAEAVVA